MGENVLVGAGGAGHASTGGGAGGGAGHAGAGRARDMQAQRGRKACERGRGHRTCRRGRKGSGDVMRARQERGTSCQRERRRGCQRGRPGTWARAGKRHVVPIKTPLPWLDFRNSPERGTRDYPQQLTALTLPHSQTRGNCTARAMQYPGAWESPGPGNSSIPGLIAPQRLSRDRAGSVGRSARPLSPVL